MKISKVTSNGSPETTKVFLENGEEIENIVGVTWSCGLFSYSKLEVQVIDVEVEALGELSLEKRSI